MAPLSVIVPVLNQPVYLKLCLESLCQTLPEGTEIIAVDNGSLTKTRKVLESFKRVKVIRNEANLGIARALNQGIEAAQSNHLVLLHTDCIAWSGWFDKLLKCIEILDSTNTKVLCPLTNYCDELSFVFSAALKKDFLKNKPSNKLILSEEQIKAVLDRTYGSYGGLQAFSEKASLLSFAATEQISSFCMVVAKQTFKEVGLFDTSFKCRGYEDKEFQFRLGHREYQVGKANFFLHHFGNITSDGPGFSVAELMTLNQGIYSYIVKSKVEPRTYSCVLYPDKNPDFAARAKKSLLALKIPPTKIVEVPAPGIFPERKALEWALPQIDDPFVALVDGDMTFDEEAMDFMLSKFTSAKIGCVGAFMRDACMGPSGYFRVWRTSVIKKITFGSDKIPNINPDTGYAEACELMGKQFLRFNDVVGDHAIELEPWNVFNIFFRMGVKQRARGRFGSAAQLHGVEGTVNCQEWGHLALFAFHCGIQVDYDGDPHDEAWHEFSYQHYKKVKPFCEALVASEKKIPAETKKPSPGRNIAIVCDKLDIAFVEGLVKSLEGTNVFVYARSGSGFDKLTCTVRVAPDPWELTNKKFEAWVIQDEIDVAVTVGYHEYLSCRRTTETNPDVIRHLASLSREEKASLPLITVVMPIYWYTPYFEAAIESVFKQDYFFWKLLIAVDTVTPEPRLMDAVERIKDPRVESCYFEHTNQSIIMNNVAKYVKTEYVLRLDSDDELTPNAIGSIQTALKNNPGTGYFYGSFVLTDDNGNVLPDSLHKAEPFSPQRLEEWFIAEKSGWRNADFVRTGGYPTDFRFGSDYFLALNMMLHKTKFLAIEDLIYRYRQHSSQRISTQRSTYDQNFYIDVARRRYLKIKTTSGISLYGESPIEMRPRIRVPRRVL